MNVLIALRDVQKARFSFKSFVAQSLIVFAVVLACFAAPRDASAQTYRFTDVTIEGNQRIEPGIRYPALLMHSAASDDRVDPLHARKFVASMQAAGIGDTPVWLRIEQRAGHGGADMVRSAVAQAVDTYAFLFDQLEMK